MDQKNTWLQQLTIAFVDSIKFMNSTLNKLVKNLLENDFKQLSQKCTGDFLKLVKQKGVYPFEYINSFKKF